MYVGRDVRLLQGRDDRLVIYNKIGQTIVIWMYVITVTTATVTTTTM